ncbi:MAG: formylglycine-generating enzyme family protein [Bacteroidales bacterium]|jgi:formylglycine-generating enzyme required for sulfatase activity|nr:formylglycine-generating enzyme family protein [Bacteroidales bacterium]
MKKVILMLSISLVCIVRSFAQGTPPTGVVAIPNMENAYIQIHEVTIADWNVYLNDVTTYEVDNEYYQSCLPDDAVCKNAYKTENYLNNPELQNYPVVGITLQQAKRYCSWRTDYENRNKKKSNTSSYLFSLPTESEFQNAYDAQKTKTSVNSLTSVNTKSKELTGLSDNVNEMTANGKTVIGAASNGLRFGDYTNADAMLGFRCKVIVR